VTLDGVLDVGFIGHFNTQLVITFNYGAIANFHNLQFTTAYAKSFKACSVFTRRFLATASDNCYYSSSVLKSSLNVGSIPGVSVKVKVSYNWRFTAN
jgi:hypothetical protein